MWERERVTLTLAYRKPYLYYYMYKY
jgi:hypothetical protein